MGQLVIPDLQTKIAELVLTAPDAQRDAPFAVQWLSGDIGRETLLLMGNPESTIKPTDLAKETTTIETFINEAEQGIQQTWQMRLSDETIGSIWVRYEDNDWLKSPNIHIMIGDSTQRGKGIGLACMDAVLKYLYCNTSYPKIYSRHLVTNAASEALLARAGFKRDGKAYKDDDGLEYQNVSRDND